ncbi:Gag-Pol polyprotein, partial [Schistosoma japonicum]
RIAVQAFRNFDVTGRDELVRFRFVEGLAHGSLIEHLLRTPPVNTADLKRTALRFITADRLTSSSAARQQSMMTVDSAIEPNHADSLSKATAIAHIPTLGINTGLSNSTWNRRPSWNNYHCRQTECFYSRRFGRNARCGHNWPRNPGKPCFHYLSSCHANRACPIMLKGRVQGVPIEILLDTGASASLVKKKLLKRLNQKAQQKQCSIALITASGDPLKVCSRTVLDLMIKKYPYRHEFLVCPALTRDMILGVDFMLEHQVSIFMDRAEATVHLHQYKGATKPVAHVGISELVRQVKNSQMIKENDRRATIAVLQQF